MDVSKQLHDALDAEDFPSRSLLTRAIASLDRPPARRGYSRLAPITAGLLAVALIATLIAIRVNSTSSSGPQLPTALAIDNLVDSQFVSPQIGFVELRSAGYVIATTSDEGRTWHQVLQLRGLAAAPVMQWLDARTGIVAGQRGHPVVVWLTTDGGVHWESHAVPVPQDVYVQDATFETAYFLNARQGWVVYFWQANCGGCGFSAERFVFETNDGGVRWTERGASGLRAAPRQLTFFTSSWGVLSSPFQELDVTHDSGRTWHESELPEFTRQCQVTCEIAGGRQALAFFPGDQGLMAVSWCVGEAGLVTETACYKTSPFKPTQAHLYRTDDGGLTWTYLRELPLSTGSIQFIDQQRAVDVGPDGVSWSLDAGATWSAPKSGAVPSGWYLVRSRFTDSEHGWLELTSSLWGTSTQSGDAAYLYQLRATTDGGRTWHQVPLPTA